MIGNIDKLSDESGHEELERKTEKNKKVADNSSEDGKITDVR